MSARSGWSERGRADSAPPRPDPGPINLYDHYNMGAYTLTMDTVYRLRCWDSDAGGVQRNMYIKGVSSPQSIFTAGYQDSNDAASLMCSGNEEFTDAKYGTACFSAFNGQHTYFRAGDVMWALYSPGSGYTLRHCGPHGPGTWSRGQIAYWNP